MPPYLIEESDINDVGAVKSAATSILSHIKNVIGKSMKTDSRIFTDKEIDSMFEFKELYTIRRFAEIAGVKFDESKFTNRKESFKSIFKNGWRRIRNESQNQRHSLTRGIRGFYSENCW